MDVVNRKTGICAKNKNRICILGLFSTTDHRYECALKGSELRWGNDSNGWRTSLLEKPFEINLICYF
jgi:hypothetical protein